MSPETHEWARTPAGLMVPTWALPGLAGHYPNSGNTPRKGKRARAGNTCSSPAELAPLPFALRHFPQMPAQGDTPTPPPPVPPTPPAVPNLLAFVWGTKDATYNAGSTGTGESLSWDAVNGNPNLNDAAAAFASTDVGRFLTLTGALTPAYDGTYPAIRLVSPTVLGYFIPGFTPLTPEAFPGTWRLQDRCTQIVDQAHGYTFTPSPVTSFLATRDNLVSGKKLLCVNRATSQRLVYSNVAVAGLVNGNVDYSVSARVLFTLTPGGLCNCFIVTNTAFSQRTYLEIGPSYISLSRQAASVTQYQVPFVPPVGTWFTMGAKYVASTNRATVYVDGLPIGQSATGTVRSLSGLAYLLIGSTGTNNTPLYVGGAACGNVAWTDAEFLAVHNAFVAYENYPWPP